MSSSAFPPTAGIDNTAQLQKKYLNSTNPPKSNQEGLLNRKGEEDENAYHFFLLKVYTLFV
jgi:hypothetical protein